MGFVGKVSRAVAVGAMVASFGAAAQAAPITPWALVSPLAMELADETKSVTSIVPVFATMVWIAIFTAASIWRFQREEF